MIRLTVFLLALGSCLLASGDCAEVVPPDEAARGVLRRVLGDKEALFLLESIAPEEGRDVFEVDNAGDKIVVRGSSGVAIASGVNWYLKHHCHCHLSFCGDQLSLPDRLPALPEKIRRVTPYRYRYCFNFCAFSYTLAWWDWGQWERMIDWMALHGINMPLAVTGQEAIWQRVYRRLGLTDEQISQFLVGPGFLPFGWMGCLDGWGGPLPASWIDQHLELQKRIVGRQRELGMTPVLQGFTGHVPAALSERFPEARFQQLPSWCQFPGTSFVDPTDPLFARIGKAYIEEQTRQFGTDHLYASDTFIEMTPPSNDPQFLADMSRAVLGAMQEADPEAKWVMQGWVFFFAPQFWQPPQAEALLTAVPNDRMIVLDLFCEAAPVWNRTQAFYGKPWVWCIIHNYGGKVGLYGGLPQILGNLRTARTSPDRGDLQGIGLIMEGFGYNPVVYDMMTDLTWYQEVPQLDEWLEGYVHRRYGRRAAEADRAWQLLKQTVYQLPGYSGSVLYARPSLTLSSPVPYDPVRLAEACDHLLAASGELAGSDTYQYDVVHALRQVLGDLGGTFYMEVVDAYAARDAEALRAAGGRLVDLMRDIDQLLGTRREFLLGKWLADARQWATCEDERRLYEWNARNLITLWGPRDSILHEYAHRQWSGLIRGFYLRRWELFLDRLERSLSDGQAWDAERFEQEMRIWEEQWTRGMESYPVQPDGDPLSVSRTVWAKYSDLARRVAEPDRVSLSTGRPTQCSSSLPPHPAGLANDGHTRNTGAFWATDTSIDPDPWWQVDLQQATSIGRVVVVSYYGDQRHYGFTVETSLDGELWDVAADQRANSEPSTRAGYTCRFAPRAARFVRIRMPHNSANSGRHLVEVMVYEK